MEKKQQQRKFSIPVADPVGKPTIPPYMIPATGKGIHRKHDTGASFLWWGRSHHHDETSDWRRQWWTRTAHCRGCCGKCANLSSRDIFTGQRWGDHTVDGNIWCIKKRASSWIHQIWPSRLWSPLHESVMQNKILTTIRINFKIYCMPDRVECECLTLKKVNSQIARIIMEGKTKKRKHTLPVAELWGIHR